MKKIIAVAVAVFFALGIVGLGAAATKKATRYQEPGDVMKESIQKNQKVTKDAQPGQLKLKGQKPGQMKDQTGKASSATTAR
jgi:hypothetical protein